MPLPPVAAERLAEGESVVAVKLVNRLGDERSFGEARGVAVVACRLFWCPRGDVGGGNMLSALGEVGLLVDVGIQAVVHCSLCYLEENKKQEK